MIVSPEICNMSPYVPGKGIEESRRELAGSTENPEDIQIIKLASNENPLGPSPKALMAIQGALSEFSRYPDAGSHNLLLHFAELYSVSTNSLAFGNGSNELIDLLIRIFCEPGDAILTSEKAFVAYKVCAQAARVKVIEAPINLVTGKKNLSLMAKAFLESETPPKLIFIDNPGNPMGTYSTMQEMREFLGVVGNREDVLVVLDEAYCEFVRASDFADALQLMKEYSNLVVLRTMSKAYGLAGVRLGVAIAQPEIISFLNRVRNPFNVNILAQAAALGALADHEYLDRSRQIVWDGLDAAYKNLEELDLSYYLSQANFVLFDTHRDAGLINEMLLKRGIILRPVGNYKMPTHLRMTIGLEYENHIVFTALHEILQVVPQMRGNA